MSFSSMLVEGKIKNIVLTIISLFTFVTIVFGGYFYVDQRYALAKDHVKLEQRVSINELEAILRDAFEELYFYRQQVRKYPNDQQLKDKLEKLEEEVKYIKGQIEKVRERVE